MSEELKVSGSLIEKFNIESGVSKAGKEWKKRNFVIETDDKFPKKVCCTLFGDKTNLIDKYSIGTNIEVKINLESIEYNGRYFTNVNVWAILGQETNNTTGGGTNYQSSLSNGLPPTEYATQPQIEEPENDLPF